MYFDPVFYGFGWIIRKLLFEKVLKFEISLYLPLKGTIDSSILKSWSGMSTVLKFALRLSVKLEILLKREFSDPV